MIRFYPNERFQEIAVDYPLKLRYAVSDRGRLISYTERFEDGTLLKGGLSTGYRTFRYSMYKKGKRSSKVFFIYKLVAQFFLPPPAEGQRYVLHLDFKLDNDVVSNLKWATHEEMLAHRKLNPNVNRATRKLMEYKQQADGHKLTVTQVMHLKKLLQDPNRKTRLKMLAKQFGISEMQVGRIKNGENWSRVKV